MKLMTIEMLTADGRALVKLLGSTKLPGRRVYQLAMFKKRLSEVMSSYQEAKQAMIDKYCAKDEKGAPVSLDGGKSYQIDPNKGKEYLAECKALLDQDCDVGDRPKLTYRDIELAELAPNEVAMLSEMIDFVEEKGR